MASPLQDLEPRVLWNRFDAICQVPRPSKQETQIVAHVRAWAAEQGFPVRQDTAGNLVLEVPASPGREQAPLTVLQAHLDMVGEKNSDVVHDFTRDPIQVRVEGDWVKAEGTTLGADNGIGVAAAMAAASDPAVIHGPLELLFTLDEETGLNGALALDPELVRGRLLINLDTEEDDSIYIGCAGAAGVTAELPLERTAAPPGLELLELAVRGLRGGHSGVDIGEHRGNAIKVAARVLTVAREAGVPYGLVALSGGSKANALARECFAQILLEPAARPALAAAIAAVERELADEFAAIEPTREVILAPAAAETPRGLPLTAACRDRLLDLLAAAPHGVLAMSRRVPGLVETSNNVAVVRTEDTRATALFSFRSSVNGALRSTALSLRSLCRLAGATAQDRPGYPGWQPDPDAAIVRRTAAVYERLFAAPPAIKAVHAGLECGILVEKLGGLEAVSIGPEIRNPHSPDERVRVSSVAKFYALLSALLAEISAPA